MGTRMDADLDMDRYMAVDLPLTKRTPNMTPAELIETVFSFFHLPPFPLWQSDN
jgi:hypothetical protein